jgi:O-acetylhomoserine/O-acetylserine sulfhydrylase-like pyridoxal-dependent enzyme
MVLHPASTSHRGLDDDALAAAGVSAGTLRLSVGIEDVDDLIEDLAHALGA